MANPNIVQVSTINGKSMGYALGTTNGTMIPPLQGAGLSIVPNDEVYKINSITISNITTGTTAWASVWRNATVAGPYGTSSVNGYLAYQIDIPPKATISILGKSTSIYLNEGHSIVAVTNQASTLTFTASYEVIS